MPVAIQLVPAIIVFYLTMFLPESPRWLIMHGRIDQGIHNLRKLRRLPADDPVLKAELDSIIATYESQKSQAPFQYEELFQNGKS